MSCSSSSGSEEDEGVDAYRKGGYHVVRIRDQFAEIIWLLMMELLGKMPKKIATMRSRLKDYFDRYGDLKRIRILKFWPLDKLLVEKNKFPEADGACVFAEFLCPLLDLCSRKAANRSIASAASMA